MSDVEAKVNQRAAAAAAAGRAPAPALTDDGNGSFGRALAAARDARGLSQADVAAQLRLSLRQVQAIEAEDLAALPEGPFVRGYVRNFARLVDLPAEPLLALLGARLKPTDPLHAEGTAAAVSPLQLAPSEPHTSRFVIGGVVLALAIFAAFGWWTMRAPPVPVAVQAPAPEPTPVPVPVPAPKPAETEAVAAPAAAPEAASAPAAEPAVAATTAGTALHFSFRDRSWVEIRQADGTVLMSQNNPAGTTQTIDGVPPYTLIVGNASKVDLEFRGQPVDLAAAVSRDDVARLRLE